MNEPEQKLDALQGLKGMLSTVLNKGGKVYDKKNNEVQPPKELRQEETPPNPIIEALSKLEFEHWKQITQHIAKTEKISHERLTRWNNLWKGKYENLSEKSKKDDREQAKKVIELIETFLKKPSEPEEQEPTIER